jgi:hypothetical protein
LNRNRKTVTEATKAVVSLLPQTAIHCIQLPNLGTIIIFGGGWLLMRQKSNEKFLGREVQGAFRGEDRQEIDGLAESA